MGQQKFQNFVQFTSLWPECSFCFLGDNGQADVRVGELMVQDFGSRIDGVFIHLVQPLDQTPGYVKGVSEERWKRLNIFFFHTYIGLAVEATRRGLITDDGLERIAKSAKEEFLSIDFADVDIYKKARQDLNRDLTEVNDLLHITRGVNMFITTRRRAASRGMNAPPGRNSTDIYVSFLQPKYSVVFSKGDKVVTCVGIGTIEKSARAQDGIYTIKIRSMGGGAARATTRVFAPASALRRVPPLKRGTPVLTTFGSGIVMNVTPEHNIYEVWLKSVATSPSITTAYLNERDVIKVLQAAVGDRVKTIIGDGIVIKYRSSDNVYCIKLGRGQEDNEFFATLYTQDKLERLRDDEKGTYCSVQ
jgi:hypothetical protein